jgi:hypothetical protein
VRLVRVPEVAGDLRPRHASAGTGAG